LSERDDVLVLAFVQDHALVAVGVLELSVCPFLVYDDLSRRRVPARRFARLPSGSFGLGSSLLLPSGADQKVPTQIGKFDIALLELHPHAGAELRDEQENPGPRPPP